MTRIQQIQSKGVRICSIVHDNLPAQSKGLEEVLSSLDDRPRIVDVPCFNHLINLVFVHAVRQNNDLNALVSEVQTWQRLLKALKINAPTIPKTRWLYVVELIEVIVSYPNLEEIMALNQQTVYAILQNDIREVPVTFVQLHEVLLPLFMLSKKLEKRTTRLSDVIPLVSDCINQWKTLRQHIPQDNMFFGILDSLVSNLIVRVRSNAFDEAVAAFVLSVNGKKIIESRFREDNTLPLNPVLGDAAREDSEDSEDDKETMSFDDCPVGDSETACQDFAHEMEAYDQLDELDMLEGDETISKKRRSMIEEWSQTISNLSLDDKLSYDFLAEFMSNAHRSLVAHGAVIPEEDGGERYYEVALSHWFSCRLDDRIISLTRVQEMSGKFLDFLVWNHILHLSKGDRNWSFWGPLAEVAMILVSCAVSEADVERLLSVQKNIQGSTTTNISAEGLTARLRLYGSRPIDSVRLDVL